jgi:hypothetical protein
MLSTLVTILCILFGMLLVVLAAIIAGRIELRRRKEGFVPVNFGDKMPTEYSPKDKRFSKIIGVFMVIWLALLLIILFTQGRQGQFLIQLLVILGIALWGLLIKLGNRITKK